ncbi:MAG: hypothetical protein K6T26_05685 [Alicyclobacillus sp.]|nr:hypothetical protein [Alicyclobacillus sp.]
MWEMVNDVADRVRYRIMPRRRNGVGTMTAVLLGASLGIAAWEALRRSRLNPGDTMEAAAAKAAHEVVESLND